MNSKKLTDKNFWDAYWEKYQLPLEMSKSKHNPFLNELLSTFDQHLPQEKNLSILEIGGSPGQYLAYLHRTKGYQLNCLDYSKIGCAKTRENFSLLGLEGTVYECDLFAKSLSLPKFDIVLSLGFIEHFSETNNVIEIHVNLLKRSGICLIKNYRIRGIDEFFGFLF